jgi:hypothetical protein
MSQDEDAAELEALKREVLEQEAANENAFVARFPPGAFTDVARALKWRVNEANILRLARVLRRVFYTFYENCSGKRPAPKAEAGRLRELRDAANLLTSPDALLLMRLEIGEPEGEIFFATAARLASFWDAQAARTTSRAGRPRQTAFHELIADLVWVYERLTKSPRKSRGRTVISRDTVATSTNSRLLSGDASKSSSRRRTTPFQRAKMR